METAVFESVVSGHCCLPTRWGTQLNGNWLVGPRLSGLGWLPTRWGTQLNGNWKRIGK